MGTSTKAISINLLLIVFVWLLNTRIGTFPPVGKLLSPITGFWNNAEPRQPAKDLTISRKDLQADVVIRYDKSGVPHIFASNDHDLYYAQGFVTARDRLWQMDLQVRTASGNLSSVFGPELIGRDLYFRRIGLVRSAQQATDSLLADPAMKTMLEAYAAGVNDYVAGLKAAEYPLEFKLLDYKPGKWTPLSSLLVLKLLTQKLSGNEQDFAMTNALSRYGMDTVANLFNYRSITEAPAVPAGTAWNFTKVALPAEDSLNALALHRQEDIAPKIEGIGSNSWAVAGSKSRSGYPILSNDPHLELTFPSVWYQVQLSSSGSNTYGVSIPGLPCIIIGYNNRVAWGLTNSEADMVDWYYIRFKDATRKEYWYDGHWQPSTIKTEQLTMPNGDVVTDTVVYTVQGPIVYDGGPHARMDYYKKLGPTEGFAMRWVMQDALYEMKTFYLLNRARNYDDYRGAISHFACPAQNFSFASADKDIAITFTGRFPLRYRNQGEFVLDGSKPAAAWQGWIPFDQIPTVRNPAAGYLSSANQAPTDSTYPYYLSWRFGPPDRALRINERLNAMNAITADSMRVLQYDSYSELAASVLPQMLRRVEAGAASADKSVLQQLEGWDYSYRKNSIGATIFSAWWTRFYEAVWQDNFAGAGALPWPNYERTSFLVIRDTASKWIDNQQTPAVETLNDVLASSLKKAADSLTRLYGPVSDKWTWGHYRPRTINHMGRIPGLGSAVFSADGTASTINALTDQIGPSWRMVVELGPEPKGYGILPGGQSGNPGSIYYDNLLPGWEAGRLNELLFMKDANDGRGQVEHTITLKK